MAKKRRGGKRRAKGRGTLEKRGGIYIARWTVGGVRFSRSTGTGDLRRAERRLDDFTAPFRVKDEIRRLEMWQGLVAGAKRRYDALVERQAALRLDEAWDAYLHSPERPDTAGASRLGFCETRFNFFVKYMERNFPEVREMREVTREHAKVFMIEGLPCKSNETRNEILSLMKGVWRIMAEDKAAKLTINPWDRIKRQRAVSLRRRELTAGELSRVCSSLEGEWRLLFAVGIYTGLRLGDCALLSWSSVDMKRNVITVVPRKTAAKTGARVMIPIHPVLRTLLKAAPRVPAPDAPQRDAVMPSIADLYVNRPGLLGLRIRQAFTDCGIETRAPSPDSGRRRTLVGFHSLRHTFVSLSANAGAPLAVVQSLVGHASVDMTRHYFHESAAALKSAVGALPDVLCGPGGARPRVSRKVRSILKRIETLTPEERLEIIKSLGAEEDG